MPNEREQWQKERSRRFREKIRLNVLKSVHHVVSWFSLLPCDLKHTQFFFNFLILLAYKFSALRIFVDLFE